MRYNAKVVTILVCLILISSMFFIAFEVESKKPKKSKPKNIDPKYNEFVNDGDNLTAAIESLSDSALKRPAAKRIRSLCKKVDAFLKTVLNEEYFEAMTKLEKDIRGKMDGNFGGKSKNDWVTDLLAQQQLNALIDAIQDADYDNDNLTFWEEAIDHGTDPFNPDTDGDGMSDGWEVANGFDPNVPDAYIDSDGDGISNAQEILWGTNPYSADTDSDSNNGNFEDGTEIAYWQDLGFSLSEAIELAKIPDVDSDGLKDGYEVYLGSNYVYWYEAETQGIRSPGATTQNDYNASDTYNSGNLSVTCNSTGWLVNFTHTPGSTPLNYVLMVKARTNVTAPRIFNANISGNRILHQPNTPIWVSSPLLKTHFEWFYMLNFTATGSFQVNLREGLVDPADPAGPGPSGYNEVFIDKLALIIFNTSEITTTDDIDDIVHYPPGGGNVVVNVTIPITNEFVPGYVATGELDLTMLKRKVGNSKDWPSKIKFDVGNDGFIEWSRSFYLIGQRMPFDFAGALNRYIKNNSTQINSNGYINVPINISSGSLGTIKLGNITILVLPNASDPLDPDTDSDGLMDGAELTAGTGAINADSDNDLLNDSAEQATGGSSSQVTTTDDTDDLVELQASSGGAKLVNLTIPVQTQAVPGYVTSAVMNLTGQTYSGQYPSDITFDIGDDGVLEWNFTGTYQSNLTMPDFAGPINNFTFQNPNLIDTSGNIKVPLRISSTSQGNISLTDILVQVDPDHSDQLIADTDSDGLIDGEEAANGLGRSDPDSDNDLMLDGYEMDGGGQNLQDPFVNNKAFAFHLKVSFDFRVNWTYLNLWIKAMRNLSNYIYDVTDGYMVIGNVEFYDNKENWDGSDIRVYFDNTQIPTGWPVVKDSWIHIPRYFNISKNTMAGALAAGDPDQLNYTAMLAHEFSHYRFYLLDEYRNAAKGAYYSIGDTKDEAPKCLMNNPLWIQDFTVHNTSEHSTPLDYFYYNTTGYSDTDTINTSDDDLDTEQFLNNGGSSWETIFRMYNSVNGTYMPAVRFDLDNDNITDTAADLDCDGTPDVLEKYVTKPGPHKNVGLNLTYDVHFTPLSIPAWYTERRLTTALGGAHNPKIGAKGNNLYVVWWDQRNKGTGVGGFDGDIFMRTSINGGQTWFTSTQISTTSSAAHPEIAVTNMNVPNVVWHTAIAPNNFEIFFYNPILGTELQLTTGSTYYLRPKIAVSGIYVHVIFSDIWNNLYYMRSNNNGLLGTWSTPTILATTQFQFSWLDIEAVGSSVHIVWTDSRHIGSPPPPYPNYEIYYRNSTNNGANWNTAVRLTAAANQSYMPVIVSTQNNLNVFWFEDRNATSELYLNFSTTNNGVWRNTDTPIITQPTSRSSTGYAASSNNTYLHLAWMDYRNGLPGQYDIYYNRSADEGSSWQTSDTQITVTRTCQNPDIIATNGRVYFVWEDHRQGYGWSEIYLRFF